MPPGAQPHLAFTVKYQGRSSTLTSDVEIFPAFANGQPPTRGRQYKALYDTGATHSSVSLKVVTELNLASMGALNVGVGGGRLPTTSHLVNIMLPNKAMFGMAQVAKIDLHGGIDVLIGMDILGVGDFTVTHYAGNTTFSYCCPSRREIDFVTETRNDYKVGRNDPCPCRSGKKYKKCHGALSIPGNTRLV